MAETTGKTKPSNASEDINSKVETETTTTESSNPQDNNEQAEIQAESTTDNNEVHNSSQTEEVEEPNAKDPLSELQNQLSEVSNKYLRALADMENNKKRAEKALQDTRVFAITNFAKELIVVLDIFEKAFVGLKVEEITDNNLKNFAIGMQLTQKELLKTLDKFGIQKIYPINEKFNPNLHEALFSKADESQENGTIFEVNESGYLLQERLLRPAKVGIIKNEKA